jgi:hypothetical protein
MIKRSIITGLLVGFLFVLVATYPVLLVYAEPGRLLARLPVAMRPLLLILTGALGLVVVALVGSLAAWRAGANNLVQGAKAGAISGLVVGIVFYTLLLGPTHALATTARLWAFQPTLQAPYPPDGRIFEFLQEMTRGSHTRTDITLLVATLIGAVEGAAVGWLNRRRAPARRSLLDVIDGAHPRRRWFAGHDDVWYAGVLAGLAGGGVVWLTLTTIFFANLKVEWPALQTLVQDSSDLLTRALFSEALSNCLLPVFVLAVLGTGALPVLLLKDPPRRHLSRFQAVLIAGLVASVPILAAIMHMIYSGLGIFRYLAWVMVQNGQVPGSSSELAADPETLALLERFVQAPMDAAPVFYLLPAIVFVLVVAIVLLWLGPQAGFYGLTLPLVFRRPADRAARIARGVHKEPSSLLPRIYQLYANDDKAVKVLPHLAFLLKDRTAARVVAAYHTLTEQPADAERAMALIRHTVAGQEGWRWRAEVGELYRVLEEGLAAKTLAQVTAIRPPPQEITSSLPRVLAKSCEQVGRALEELGKVERVDDLSTKIIFLNSAQSVLLDLHRVVEQEDCDEPCYRTPFPELAILHALFDFWQGFILTATRDLQGRAHLEATLLAHRTTFAPRVRQCVVVTNNGLNVAQNVHLQVAAGEGYEVVEGADQRVEILSPQESREMEFWIIPDGPRRLRLAWKIHYDDAVDRGRQVEFADAMELFQEESGQPFQRIFPIPYVTGTPLRSGEMFVGRQDVFDFVREHLLGTYQNNVIVLHGQRRTGKTSILYRLQEVLADTHVAVLVDMQGKAARGTPDFLYALSDDIAYALEGQGMAVELPERAEYEEAPEFAFRSRFLRAVVKALDRRNLLLMFDEFEELQKRVEDGRLESEIFSFLRNLMQHEPRLDFVFSGTHKLEELGAEYWSILFNIAAYKRITFLDPAEVHRLVTEPVASYGMEYDPLAIERIIQVTAGHPYFTQVVGHEMVAFHNETERNYLTVTCVDQVLERIIERGEAHFKYIWAGATPDEQWLMLALTDLLPDAEATATPVQIVEELYHKGCTLEGDPLARALALLQSKDIVTRSGPQSSLYRFKIDLIRRWIATTRPAVDR